MDKIPFMKARYTASGYCNAGPALPPYHYISPERTDWTLRYNLDNGDIQKDKAPTYAQIVDETIAAEAIAKVGGATEIGGCKL